MISRVSTMSGDIHHNALEPGCHLHWYRIDRVLGQGGFGITYLAHDFNLDRHVAIKEYFPVELAVREGAVFVHPVTEGHDEAYHAGLESFVAEARMLAKFEHPNIIRVLNVFVAHNSAYLVMSYEEGESLHAVFERRGTLEEADLLSFLMPILDGLERVHRDGCIHRDMKPGSILVRKDGSPVLIDFGAARQSVGEETKTLSRVFSPGYAALEQYRGEGDQQGPWTDIYGLGATLYRGIAGVVPMDALHRSQSVRQGEKDPLARAVQVGGCRYGEGFLRAIDHALNLEATERPQTTAAWRREFALVPQPSGDLDGTRNVPEPMFIDRADAPVRLKRRAAGRRAARAGLIVGLIGVGTVAWLNRGWILKPEQPVAPATQPEIAFGDAEILQGTAAERMPPGPTEPPRPVGEAATGGESRSQPDELPHRQDAQVNALLAGATDDINAGRLTSPKDDNALDKYRSVLALRPDQAQAKQGIQGIVDRFIQRAREAMARKDWGPAQTQLDQAAGISEATTDLTAVRAELSSLKAEAEGQRLAEERAAKRKETERTMQRLAASARRAAARGQWSRAEAYIDQAANAMPDSEEVPLLRKALNTRKAQAQAEAEAEAGRQAGRRETDSKRVETAQRSIELARQAMDRKEWGNAQSYIDQAASILPDSEDVVLMQGDLISRAAEAERRRASAVEPPVAPTSTEPSEPLGQWEATTLVKIQKAISTRSSVRPGDTVEFVTEYLLTLPEGAKNTYVEVTWVLKRNGRKLGEEGIASGIANAGVNAATNELALPHYVKPGTYVVEHKVRAGDRFDVARSYFVVVSN